MSRMDYWRRFFRVMASARIVGNAAKVSLVVGTMLNLINQGDYLFAGHGVMVGHILLNYLVPYGVASYSGARALPIHESGAKRSRTKDDAVR